MNEITPTMCPYVGLHFYYLLLVNITRISAIDKQRPRWVEQGPWFDGIKGSFLKMYMLLIKNTHFF